MSTTRTRRLVLKCDQEGRVVQADEDARALLGARLTRGLLPLIVDSASAAKCERLLTRARAGGAYGWELHLVGSDGVFGMLFAALPDPGRGLKLLAADSAEDLLALLEQSAPQLQPTSGRDDEPPSALASSSAPLDALSRVNSDLVSLHRDLAKSNAQLAAVTKQRNELLGVAAHDLRNPLLVVQGYCELLSSAVALGPATQRELVERVQRASALMLDVLDHTLEYAHLETDGVQARFAELDLAALARECAEGYRRLAEQKQINLRLECEAGLPRLRLDRTHLAQIIGNLLSNAIKYSPPGSLVELTLAHGGGHVLLAVTDHGQGIPEGELPLLFRPFQTTSARPTAGEASTGLGLAIVRKLVAANGGKISVQSILHEGSTFTITFPLAPATKLTGPRLGVRGRQRGRS